jgi:inner membrane protein
MAAARLRADSNTSRSSLAVSMLLWSGLSMLPDADVVGFAFGVRYGDAWGHRGATHSFAFAIAAGAFAFLSALGSPGLRKAALPRALLVAMVVSSHGLLDALTDGGRGCALLWPFSESRHFAPVRPIPVAPIGLGFFSARGLRVALVELAWFAPLFAYALWPRRKPARAGEEPVRTAVSPHPPLGSGASPSRRHPP